MKRFLALFSLITIICAFAPNGDSSKNITSSNVVDNLDEQESLVTTDDISNSAYDRGEYLRFRVHYGFVNAGDMTIQVNPKYYRLNNKICYRINAEAKSSGVLSMTYKVKDTWRTYVDTATLAPLRFYRAIEEGKYTLMETSHFNNPKGKVTVEAHKKKEHPLKTTEFEVPHNVQDIVSAYYFLRNVDYSQLKEGDKIPINAFFEDELYEMNIVYLGQEKVRTRFGKIQAYKLLPEMPNNEVFKGKDSIKFWISADKNRIPIKVKAEMFVGAIEIDLKDYDGLRHSINFD